LWGSPEPQTPNPKPQTPNPKTLNPKPDSTGKIYELDGLKAGPVEVGSGSADELLSVAAGVVQKYAADAEEHRISLMALAPSVYK